MRLGTDRRYLAGPAAASMRTMVRFLVLYKQPHDPAAFDRHYREIHIPLAKKLPGLRRYTISRDPGAVRGGEPYYLIAELPIRIAHAIAASQLPRHHEDPFDRMLIAQAFAEGLTVVTHDKRFEDYGVALLPA